MTTHLSFSAVLPLIRDEWGVSNAQVGLVAAAGQGGFVVAVLALSALTDHWSTKRVFLVSAATAALATVGFGVLAHDVASALLLKVLGGVGIGGTYMPGVKLVSLGQRERRGLVVAAFVASIPLGLALSLGATGALTAAVGWRGAFVALGIVALVAAALAGWGLRSQEATPPPAAAAIAPAGLDRPAALLGLAYFAHNWELMGMWSWMAAFLTASLVSAGSDVAGAAPLASMLCLPIFALGAVAVVSAGWVSDRVGRTAATLAIMLASIVISFTIGWLVSAPLPLLVAVGTMYFALAIADSPVLSTALTEIVPPHRVGSALGVYAAVGWLAGSISPALFGLVLDVTGGHWGAAFGMLGAVAVLGPVAVMALRRHPASIRLARGRR